MSMASGEGAVKPILMLLHVVAVVAMLLSCLETASVNGQLTLGQCLGKCGQDVFTCITGCASVGQQELASCISCLSTCAAHIPAPPPSKTPPLPPNTGLHK